MTKDITHLRRLKTSCLSIKVEANTKLSITKETFLSNHQNKQQFLNFLSNFLHPLEIHCAEEDADLLIVQTALSKSLESPTVVVGDDTDLLVLLCH